MSYHLQVSVVPFLSLGIGIDDMFIFIYTLVSIPQYFQVRQQCVDKRDIQVNSFKTFSCG